MMICSGILTFARCEYRYQGGEIHRRPVDREWRTPWDAAWVVLRPEEVPPQIMEFKDHMRQHRYASSRWN